MHKVKFFVDFWNLQLRWNDHMRSNAGGRSPVPLNWRKLPSVLMEGLRTVLEPNSEISLKGTCVFASVNPHKGTRDDGLKGFLHKLSQAPGFQVTTRDRKSLKELCPDCPNAIDRTVQKGVSTDIVTALFEGAINNSYDIAVLISNDADYVPAIDLLQNRLNKEIIHVGFDNSGSEVRKVAWRHILLDGDLATKLIETKGSAP
jgi:uncharacterized LabA/DUF88 family protein